MNMDDVSCITVLAAAMMSIAIAAAGFLGNEMRRDAAIAKDCPLAHSAPSAIGGPPSG